MSGPRLTREQVKAQYERALESFVEKVKKDHWILAAILFGSMSYDEIWEQSDIDIFLIAKDDAKKSEVCHFVENEVNFHAYTMSRSEFRKTVEGSLQSSFIHSSVMHGTLLYTHDESIRAYHESTRKLGERDRDIQMMRAAASAIPSLQKAQKFIYVKNDPHWSFRWLVFSVESLAQIEVLSSGQITKREVIQQAMTLNPAFFRAIYSDLMDQPKTLDNVSKAIETVENYLLDKTPSLFKPLFDWLAEEGGVRTSSQISAHFRQVAQSGDISMACEWLSYHEFIEPASKSVRLTQKSHVDVEEAAYYYDRMNPFLAR